MGRRAKGSDPLPSPIPPPAAFGPVPVLNLPASPNGAAGIWLTADQHFGHTNILTYARRPFEDVEAHDLGLRQRWNERVRPEDWVFVLGDFAMAGTPARNVAQLGGRKVLIAGNHDRCWTQRGTRYRGDEAAEARDAGFEIVVGYGMARVRVGDLALPLLSHLPGPGAHPDRPSRHDRYRPAETSGLCGHVHTAWMDNGGWINVGVDAWDLAPISWPELVDFYPHLGAPASPTHARHPRPPAALAPPWRSGDPRHGRSSANQDVTRRNEPVRRGSPEVLSLTKGGRASNRCPTSPAPAPEQQLTPSAPTRCPGPHRRGRQP